MIVLGSSASRGEEAPPKRGPLIRLGRRLSAVRPGTKVFVVHRELHTHGRLITDNPCIMTGGKTVRVSGFYRNFRSII